MVQSDIDASAGVWFDARVQAPTAVRLVLLNAALWSGVAATQASANTVSFSPRDPVAGRPITATVTLEGETPTAATTYAVGVDGPTFCENQTAWSSTPTITGLALPPGHHIMHACVRTDGTERTVSDCYGLLTVWPSGGRPALTVTLPHDTTLASFLAHGTWATVSFSRPVTATFTAATTAGRKPMDGAPAVTGSLQNQRSASVFIAAPVPGSQAALHARGVRLVADLSADATYGVMYQPYKTLPSSTFTYTEEPPVAFVSVPAPAPALVAGEPVVHVAPKLRIPLVCPNASCAGTANASIFVSDSRKRRWREIKLRGRPFVLVQDERRAVTFTLPAHVRRAVLATVRTHKHAWMHVTTTAVNPITGSQRTSVRTLVKLVR
jgi:hypothetical protein